MVFTAYWLPAARRFGFCDQVGERQVGNLHDYWSILVSLVQTETKSVFLIFLQALFIITFSLLV